MLSVVSFSFFDIIEKQYDNRLHTEIIKRVETLLLECEQSGIDATRPLWEEIDHITAPARGVLSPLFLDLIITLEFLMEEDETVGIGDAQEALQFAKKELLDKEIKA